MDKNDTLDMYMDMLGATNYNRRTNQHKEITKVDASSMLAQLEELNTKMEQDEQAYDELRQELDKHFKETGVYAKIAAIGRDTDLELININIMLKSLDNKNEIFNKRKSQLMAALFEVKR